jgi:NADH:ubiquinone oxidoreductase subunit 5 (subunit L)/multisubunit Na+/H+ antiporter MnhA subunit
MNGFLSKEMFFAETMIVGGTENWWMSVAAVMMGLFSVVYSLRFISVFFGPLAQGPAGTAARTAALDAGADRIAWCCCASRWA